MVSSFLLLRNSADKAAIDITRVPAKTNSTITAKTKKVICCGSWFKSFD
jgi:hypothetical protein